MISRYQFILVLTLVCGACTGGQSSIVTQSTGQNPKAMVVTANPHASKAGADILRAGGSAVDAAIAIESVLSLVEPQSSGLGGGGFLVYFDNKTKQVSVFDGRETAPSQVKADMFLQDNGDSMGFIDAKTSGLSTGVPGMVAMLKLAHDDYGVLPWGTHFSEARKLAVQGFEVSPRLQGMIQKFGRFIPKTRDAGTLDAYRYFFDKDGEPIKVGHLLKNPEYAKTLDLIAQDANNFYRGDLAQEIVKQVAHSPRAGNMTLQDLSMYKAKKRTALCTSFRNLSLCGAQPASSWVAVGMIMKLLESVPEFSQDGVKSVLNWAMFAEAQRLAYADRDQYVADDAFVEVPLEGMLNTEYLDERAAMISTGGALNNVKAGNPWQYQFGVKKVAGFDPSHDVAGTTHFVVVDKAGNVGSMTARGESIFGSTRMAGGMFLNNQLTDFSFQPTDAAGLPIANAVAAGKRPRSSMSPTIVIDQDGDFKMATGSPGGNSIIAYTAKTLVGVLAWGLTPQQAVELPNMVARGDSVRIEKDRASPDLIQGLRNFGYNVKESAGENSGLSVVVKTVDGELLGGVDPRREGIVEIVH